MDLALAFSYVWRRKWVLLTLVIVSCAIGTLSSYSVSTSSPYFTTRGVEFGSAEASMLVDARQSVLGRADTPLLPLGQRGATLAALFSSETVSADIAHAMRVRRSSVGITSIPAGGTKQPDALLRSRDLVLGSKAYQVSYSTTSSTPVIRVLTQAPSSERAAELADVAVSAAQRYLRRRQFGLSVPAGQQVVIRRIERAGGGTVNEGKGPEIAAAIGLGTFLLTSLVLFTVLAALDDRRWSRLAERPSGRADT